MKKRWLVYVGVVVVSVIGTLLLKGPDETSHFLFYWPIRGFSYLLESMSLASSFGNFMAWILLILVSGVPLGLGYLLLKKDLKLFDIVGLIIIGITLGITIYFIINMTSIPAWLAKIQFFQEVADVKPLITFGLINVWCGIVLSYLVIRIFILHEKIGKYFLSIMVFLVSFLIMIYIQSVLISTYGFDTYELRIQTLGSVMDAIIFISMVIFMEFIIQFIETIKDQSFSNTLPRLTKWIKLVTLVMVSTSLVKLILINFLQLIFMGELNNISFEFTIDLVPWLLVFFFYGLYHYISHANDVMEEAELTI